MKYAKDSHPADIREQGALYRGAGGTKRLTIDVPQDLHVAIKVSCARRGQKMTDVIRAILQAEFGESSGQ